MGSAVKTVVGIGLALFAPTLATATWGLGLAAGSTAAMLAAGAITLVGASIAGSAISYEAPDIGGVEGYTGQKLQTQKSNTAPVPIVYGENRMAGNIIFQKTNAEVNADNATNGYNRDYWSIITLTNHESNALNDVFAGEDTMNSLGSNKYELQYVHVKYYPTSGDSGMSLADVDFVTTDTGTTQTGTQLNLQTITTYSTNDVLDFSGNVDHELYIEIDCAESGTQSYSGTGTSSTLESGASAANCYYNEYGEGYHGDLSATIDLTPVDSTTLTASRNHLLELTASSGRGSISITQQPSSANGYRAIIYIYDGDSGEGAYTFTATFTEQSSTGTFVHIPSGVSFLAVHQVFDGEETKNTQLANINVELQGKKIRTITNSTTISSTETYSVNPAEILLDLLRDSLSIQDDEIDIASFYQAKLDCNTNGFTCNISLIQQSNVQSIIQDVLSTCRGQIVRSDSKWKLKVDKKNQTSVAFLDNDDVLNNSLTVSMAGSTEIANRIIVKYVNPDDEWLTAQVEKYDGELITLDDQTLEKTLDIKGVTSATQANKLAEITLNSMRYSEDALGNRVKQTPLQVAFATTVKNAHLEVGDIFDLQHDILDRTRKFMILSVETDQSGLIQITAREYAETHYKDSAGNYLI